jgi:hypothetical protein
VVDGTYGPRHLLASNHRQTTIKSGVSTRVIYKGCRLLYSILTENSVFPLYERKKNQESKERRKKEQKMPKQKSSIYREE